MSQCEIFKGLDISAKPRYTLSEEVVTHDTEKEFREAITQAANDISNIYPASPIRKPRLSEVAAQLKRRGFLDFRGYPARDAHQVVEIVSAFRHSKLEQLQVL